MQSLGSRDRRTLLFGAAGVALIVAAGKLVPLWRDWEREQRESVAVAVARLDVTRRRIADARRADVATAPQLAMDPSKAVITEANISVAGARLAEIVTNVSDRAALRVASLQIRNDTAFKERFARIGVRLAATGDVESLVNLLVALRGSTPLLAIRELTIVPADPAGADSRPEILRFQVLVEALAFNGNGRPQ